MSSIGMLANFPTRLLARSTNSEQPPLNHTLPYINAHGYMTKGHGVRWYPRVTVVILGWCQEDEAVRKLVDKHGDKSWVLVASFLPNRTGKQIRERWHNQLDPMIMKGPDPPVVPRRARI